MYLQILDSCKNISHYLRYSTSSHVETTNVYGDLQLDGDLLTEQIIFAALKKSPSVFGAVSEETPKMVPLNQQGEFVVTFDPLDGSSVVEANMAVGSIFGIWKKRPDQDESMEGYSGREMVGAALATYGHRTSIVVHNTASNQVDELVLSQDGLWQFSRKNLQMKPDATIYLPGNTRACLHNMAYKRLYAEWADRKMTLRYSGAMAADCFLVLVKGDGVFLSLSAEDKGVKAKLRVLYECVPIAYLVEMAGGKSSFGNEKSLLDLEVQHFTQRTDIIIGSPNEVSHVIKTVRF